MYHEVTKHSQHRYARSLGYMDWDTQPNPFREYIGAKKILLPLALDNPTPPYNMLSTKLPAAPLLKESISQLLQFSMAIAAYKSANGNSWAVRCNASSGNLHPTESYLILPPLLEEQNNRSSVLHYAPKNHELEELVSFETDFWQELPENSFLIALSSISWREVWKYGERAFRYVNLDVGHAWQSFLISAKLLGWELTRLDTIHSNDINTLLGLNQEKRFHEKELGDMLLVVSAQNVQSSLSIDRLLEALPLTYNGVANKLSPSMYDWEIIPSIEDATSTEQIAQPKDFYTHYSSTSQRASKNVILNRRSIHVMDKIRSHITKEEFFTLLKSVSGSLDGKENSAHLVLMVQRVEEFNEGIYIFVRNKRDRIALQESMHRGFLWKECELKNLYLLEEREIQIASQAISCSQAIASDGAFSLGMLCNFAPQINEYGAHRYKELFWECGAVGQQLYLDATSMGLSGTGIGCFLDDMFHSMLGIKDNTFQSLYHFTVGRGYVDSRIQTQEPYEERE